MGGWGKRSATASIPIKVSSGSEGYAEAVLLCVTRLLLRGEGEVMDG